MNIWAFGLSCLPACCSGWRCCCCYCSSGCCFCCRYNHSVWCHWRLAKNKCEHETWHKQYVEFVFMNEWFEVFSSSSSFSSCPNVIGYSVGCCSCWSFLLDFFFVSILSQLILSQYFDWHRNVMRWLSLFSRIIIRIISLLCPILYIHDSPTHSLTHRANRRSPSSSSTSPLPLYSTHQPKESGQFRGP